MRARLLAGSIALLGVCAPVAAQTVLNGSFEDPLITSGYFLNIGAPGFDGWTIVTGDVDVVRLSGGQGWAAQDGNQSLDLNGFTNGAITQTVNGFTPGGQYLLTYYYNGTNVGGLKTELTFIGGTSVLPPIIETASSDNIWRQRQVEFTAFSTDVGLTFSSLNVGSTQGMAIDNVSITAVPEPHEWAMMLAGLGIVGWAARRRIAGRDLAAAAPLTAV